MARPSQRQGDLSAMMRIARTASPVDPIATTHAQRKAIANLCRLLGALSKGESFDTPNAYLAEVSRLSPRMRQTLDRLLIGDSEKQIAYRLAVSTHTVHVYVKAIYRGFDVNSRGELLAKFVRLPASLGAAEQSLPAAPIRTRARAGSPIPRIGRLKSSQSSK